MFKKYIIYLLVGVVVFTIIFSFNLFSDGNLTPKQQLSQTEQAEWNELKRVINVLYNAGNPIGQDRYAEFNSSLNEFEGKVSDEELKELRDKLWSILLGERQKFENESINESSFEEQANEEFPEEKCQSNPNPVFTRHITDVNKISSIQIPPVKIAGHLTTHSYINTDGQRVPVYAPVDMTLITGAHYIGGPYGLIFRVSCEIQIRFGHITDPIDEIKEVFPAVPTQDSRYQEIKQEIFFKAGDLIGYTKGTDPGAGNWDFGVYDSNHENRYASDPEWNWSTTYTSAVCPYKFFSTDLKATYKQKFVSQFGNAVPDGESFCVDI